MNTHPAAPDQLVSTSIQSSRRRDRRLWNAVLMTTRVILTFSFSRCERLPCETLSGHPMSRQNRYYCVGNGPNNIQELDVG